MTTFGRRLATISTTCYADDLAKFWMRFLGCGFLAEPRVATQRFFETTLSFINTTVTEPTVKSEIYDHLQSQLKSKTKTFAPKTFIQEFVPEEYQDQFRAHLEANNVPASSVPEGSRRYRNQVGTTGLSNYKRWHDFCSGRNCRYHRYPRPRYPRERHCRESKVSDVEQARQRWIVERPKFDAFASLLQNRIQPLIKVLGIWFEISARAKDVNSLVKKLILKPEHSFETLPDKVGVRAVIRYRSDIERIVQGIVTHFDTKPPDDKVKKLGTEKVGYQSVHIDLVRLKEKDANATEFPPNSFWAEVQVRTLAQHLWSEMSHDSVYKNDAMISKLPDDLKRRVNLMSGQIEVADREFDRLNLELSDGAGQLLHALERHYYRYSSRRPDLELTMRVLNIFLPYIEPDLCKFHKSSRRFSHVETQCTQGCIR